MLYRLTSAVALAALGRTTLASGGGFIADAAGWTIFFAITALAALPSLLLLWWLQQRGHFRTLENKTPAMAAELGFPATRTSARRGGGIG